VDLHAAVAGRDDEPAVGCAVVVQVGLQPLQQRGRRGGGRRVVGVDARGGEPQLQLAGVPAERAQQRVARHARRGVGAARRDVGRG
jgi:hypothetical protein